MRYDPIPDLARLGYTWREAAFLHLVGTTSGFFLYRQYCEFMHRKLGGIAQQLIEKGTALDHIEVLSYRQRRHVYHLKSRAIYRILGNAEADYHRSRGDAEVKTRLMVLDYLLANRKQPFLAREEEKVAFFLDTLRVSRALLPSRFSVAFDRAEPVGTRYFPERFPIHVDEPPSVRGATVRFTYIDYGALSIKRFARFLERYKPSSMKSGSLGSSMSQTHRAVCRQPKQPSNEHSRKPQDCCRLASTTSPMSLQRRPFGTRTTQDSASKTWRR